MACLYKYNDEWYTEEELKEQFGIEDITLFEPNEGISPRYESYINYKENLIYQLENRLNRIKKEKKDHSTNLEYVKQLTSLENEIDIRINGSQELGILGLVNEIGELKAAPPVSKLDYYVEKDFERLDYLSNSINEEDLDEARNIVNFYQALGTFDINEDHPLFETEQLYNDKGVFILPDDIRNKLEFYKNKVQEYENIITKKENTNLENLVNTNSKINQIFGDKQFDYNELFYKKEGLKDISWIDMFVMDISNGILSDNGIIPQVVMNTLQNTFESKLVKAKEFENKINGLQDDVERELGNINNGKYKLSSIGILGVKGVSYDLFRARTKDGLYKDNITQRYSPEYFTERTKMIRTFNNAISKAVEEQDASTKAQLFNEAYRDREDWYKKNTILINPGKLPEVINNSEFRQHESFYQQDKSEAYAEELKSILGEQGYQEEVQKQIKLIKDYEVALEVFTDNVLSEYNVEDTDASLPIEGKNKIETWIKRNNPFFFSENYDQNKPIKKGKSTLNPTMAYNYSIPRKTGVTTAISAQGKILQDTNEDTGYYDSRFETIENNPTLKEFHNVLLEVTQSMYDNMPTDVREKFSPTSIPALRKNIAEILFDDSIPILERISKIMKEIYDKIRGFFGINTQDSFSQAKVDPITGLPQYKVNASFFKTNKEEINKRYSIELLRLKQSMGLEPKDPLTVLDSYNIGNLDASTIQILSDNLGMTETQIRSNFGDNISPAKLLKDGITDQVVKSNSFDLPKILKLYSYLTQEFSARQEVLPIMKMIKSHYEEIKTPSTTNIGENIKNLDGKSRLEGERKNANRQFNSWFERVILGNYGSKNELGDDRIKRIAKLGTTGNEKIDSLTSKLGTTITGKILNTDEKILRNKIRELRGEIKDEDTLKELDKLEKGLGKDFSATATFDAIFNFIRFKGLGWNISSYVTNFMEGQIANFTIAATGDYFKPENIYRANDIVKGSFLKNVTFNKVATPGAKKARILMDRYRILQDASNELQKASTKTAFSAFKKLSPYEGTRRTEYLNQTPLMIAVLLDIEIKDKEGNVSNVWDAIDSEGQLKEEFRTDENISNWEKADGSNYNDFSSLINKAIVNAHGDYDQLRGNIATEFVAGKALLMFKRWMARQFYQRLGKEQIDLEAGIGDFKGRYRSHTQVSGALHGGIIGFAGLSLLGAGPLGLLIGGAGGLLAGKFYGANTDIGFLKELSIVGKELFMNMVRIPTNTITGKETIRNIKLEGLEGLSPRDINNMKSNLVDMSLTLGWVALLLFTKAMFWDDDDEEGSLRRNTHNILANKFMQLASQSAQYVNPVDTWDNTFGSVAILRFLNDVGQTAVKAQAALEGRDILQSGPNAGESALMNQVEKTFFPGVLKDNIGFASQMERQFKKSPFDTWFFTEETKAEKEIKRIRAKERNRLQGEGLKDKELNKALNSKYRTKKKGESYIDLLEDYNKVK